MSLVHIDPTFLFSILARPFFLKEKVGRCKCASSFFIFPFSDCRCSPCFGILFYKSADGDLRSWLMCQERRVACWRIAPDPGVSVVTPRRREVTLLPHLIDDAGDAAPAERRGKTRLSKQPDGHSSCIKWNKTNNETKLFSDAPSFRLSANIYFLGI